MIKMRPNKNGIIFIMVIMFIVITLTLASALYIAIISSYSIIGVNMVSDVGGYYAALAGLRYADIMLQDVNVVRAVITNGSYTCQSVKADYPDLANDLKLQGSAHDLTITIENSGNNTYKATASYK